MHGLDIVNMETVMNSLLREMSLECTEGIARCHIANGSIGESLCVSKTLLTVRATGDLYYQDIVSSICSL
ncbi:hypothetical protein FRX31_032127 [Thalictrum thalictroides]|uniref:Uncharacterized protein n=1 Tax=Thalictrum thalictroides TaxID=46969 RepID=A0A7J6V087_THATH|nr:hypothetical protein FRX31_032127 [Thalictrum thalictroides]